MKLYSTVKEEVSTEYIIEKSKFISCIKPCYSKEDAERFFSVRKRKYWDASHNVPAMVIGDNKEIQWCSDDGEPRGTSGAPILDFLLSRDLTNVALIVTRYFGGIKLGTGGLVRAYTKSAKDVVDKSIICDVLLRKVLECKIDYKLFNRIKEQNLGKNSEIIDVEYLDKVSFKIICPEDDVKENIDMLNALTSGEQVINKIGQDVFKSPRI